MAEQEPKTKKKSAQYPLYIKDAELWRRFKAKCASNDITMVDKIWYWIRQYVNGEKNF